MLTDDLSERSFSAPREIVGTTLKFMDSEVCVGSAHIANDVTTYDLEKNVNGLSKLNFTPPARVCTKREDPMLKWICRFCFKVLTFDTL
ncbi:MAG: hypothetical protein CMF85_03995 [Candidatus Marinimicrobia bacterium]|nr:hypothetical protein [Candidatus Neomarinimicrobiota bacterium]|tara:strand:+ start:2327 stop:2593 length:267 start_codon:yes stop_codon:yes gene_type:complete